MGDVSKGEGRTVLFVSHNMSAIKKLCNMGMLLNYGKLVSVGNTSEIIDSYLLNSELKTTVVEIPEPKNAAETLGYATKLQIEDLNSNVIKEIPVGSPWQVRVAFKINKRAEHFIIGMGINNMLDVNLRTTWSSHADLAEGEYEAVFTENQLIFAPGSYNLILGLTNYERSIQYLENVATFTVSDVIDPLLPKSILKVTDVGVFLNPMDISINAI